MASAIALEEFVAERLSERPRLNHVGVLWRACRCYREFLQSMRRIVERDCRQQDTVWVLDFDVVCAALWRTIPPKQRPMDRLLGLPQSTYHFFKYGQRPFCLPLGTQLEMAAWLLRTAGGQQWARPAEKAVRTLLTTLEALAHADDSSRQQTIGELQEVIRESGPKFPELIEKMLGRQADLTQLRAVKQHEHLRDWRELFGERSLDSKAYESGFPMHYAWLDWARRERIPNNLADAHNLAWYLAIGPGDSRDVFPIFVSGTRVVRASPGWSQLDFRLPRRPLSDPHFLSFCTAFEQYCEQPTDAHSRILTKVNTALDGLDRVFDAEEEVRTNTIRPQWRNERGWLSQEITWEKFGADFHFRQWARAYLDWRRAHLDQVLSAFEHCRTTDDQLRRSFLQTVSAEEEYLICALRDPDRFQEMLGEEGEHEQVAGSVAQITERIKLALEQDRPAPEGQQTGPAWQQHLTAREERRADAVVWVLRTAETEHLVVHVLRSRDGLWAFTWPVQLDLVGMLRCTMALRVSGAKCDQMRIAPRGGEAQVVDLEALRRVAAGETGKDATEGEDRIRAVAEAVGRSGLDFAVSVKQEDTSVSFVSDTTLFPESQGMDLTVRMRDIGDASALAQALADIYDMTGRAPVCPDILKEAICYVLKSDVGPLESRGECDEGT